MDSVIDSASPCIIGFTTLFTKTDNLGKKTSTVPLTSFNIGISSPFIIFHKLLKFFTQPLSCTYITCLPLKLIQTQTPIYFSMTLLQYLSAVAFKLLIYARQRKSVKKCKLCKLLLNAVKCFVYASRTFNAFALA